MGTTLEPKNPRSFPAMDVYQGSSRPEVTSAHSSNKHIERRDDSKETNVAKELAN